MEKKNIDWENIGFSYQKTDKRYVADFRNGAWSQGALVEDDMVTISECAGVLQYAQTCFEGLKAYTTVDGRIVMFRPDLNASRMEDSCRRLMMPVFPQEKFVEAAAMTVQANIPRSVSISLSTSIGLATCPSIPASSASCLSSSKAFAVIATIGMDDVTGFSIARIARVAS